MVRRGEDVVAALDRGGVDGRAGFGDSDLPGFDPSRERFLRSEVDTAS